MKKIKNKIMKIIHLCFKPYMRILPGNVAYSLMMSIIPIFSIIIIGCNFLNLSSTFIFDKIGGVIPAKVLDILVNYLLSNPWGNVIVIIAGIWAASSGPNALIIASNMVYGTNDGNYLKRRIKAILLTILLVLVIIINLLFLVFGNNLLTFILNLFNLKRDILNIFNFVKWPIALILVYFIIKILYVTCPNKQIKSKTTTKGAVFTTVMWLFVSAIYSFYTNNLANYSRVYGGLANIIILMVWLYILSYILVIGIAINVSEYEEKE